MMKFQGKSEKMFVCERKKTDSIENNMERAI